MRPMAKPQYQDVATQTNPVEVIDIQSFVYGEPEVPQVQAESLKGALQDYFRDSSYQLGDFFR